MVQAISSLADRRSSLRAYVGAHGELLLLPICIEHDRSALGVLVHKAGILKVSDEVALSLNARIRNFTYFLRVESAPLAPMKLVVKRRNILRPSEVDKRVSNIALVLEVDGQVNEVEMATVMFFKRTQ